MQISFNPIDYCFSWTSDWYSWDSKAAHAEAKKKRDETFKNMVSEGKKCKKFTLSKQLVKRGGIGTEHPEIEHFVTGYYIQVYD